MGLFSKPNLGDLGRMAQEQQRMRGRLKRSTQAPTAKEAKVIRRAVDKRAIKHSRFN